jgi:hypothetical protein
MTFFDTHAPARSTASPARDDLIRTALILMLFATLALGIMLAAGAPGSPLAPSVHTGEVWHGNVASSTAK